MLGFRPSGRRSACKNNKSVNSKSLQVQGGIMATILGPQRFEVIVDREKFERELVSFSGIFFLL